MKKNILYLDTSDNKKTLVRLETEGKKIELVRETESWVSQDLLPMINEILSEQNLSPADLKEIKINTGPGSFTGLRVGAAVANILGWYLDIPVNGRKGRIFPVYQ